MRSRREKAVPARPSSSFPKAYNGGWASDPATDGPAL